MKSVDAEDHFCCQQTFDWRKLPIQSTVLTNLVFWIFGLPLCFECLFEGIPALAALGIKKINRWQTTNNFPILRKAALNVSEMLQYFIKWIKQETN